jgi:hypothetical protein
VVLYGCEIQSPGLREESSLRISVNRMLRRIFDAQIEEAT